MLLGGYFGCWLPATQIRSLRLAPEQLADHGASLGCGVIVALGSAACPVAETSRIADYFAAQSAGQCGPCVNGLRAIADTVQQLATGTAARPAYWDLERWTSELPRRGACQHPDGAVRFIASALRVFADEFQDHARRGPCERCSQRPTLPAPPATTAFDQLERSSTSEVAPDTPVLGSVRSSFASVACKEGSACPGVSRLLRIEHESKHGNRQRDPQDLHGGQALPGVALAIAYAPEGEARSGVTDGSASSAMERQQQCRPTRPRLPVRPGDAVLRRRRSDGRPSPLAPNS